MRAIVTLHDLSLAPGPLSLSPEQLDLLLDAIEAAQHRIVPLSELLREPGRPDRIALTFDDGLASVAEEALPILARRGLTAAVFVVTGRVGTDNAWPGQPEGLPTRPTMGWGELEALVEAGWELGSHSVSHARLTDLSPPQLTREIEDARATITDRIGGPPVAFAYPYGAVNPSVQRAVARVHHHALGTRLAVLDPALDHPLDLPRLDAHYLRDGLLRRSLGTPGFAPLLALRRQARELAARWRGR